MNPSTTTSAPRGAVPAVRLLLVDPTTPPLVHEDDVAALRALLRPSTELRVGAVDGGPPAIQTAADERLAAAAVRDLLARTGDDVDAAVVACTLDVGAAPGGRPVLGPGHVSMQLATTLGSRFSIVVAMPDGVAEMEALARRYGYGDRLASVRSLGIPIVELRSAGDAAGDALAREAASAVDDGADVVILGCTVGSFAVSAAAAQLAAAGLHVPLIDPLAATVLIAEAAVVSSRAGQPEPRGSDA